MSVCDPNSPNACDTCKAYYQIRPGRSPLLSYADELAGDQRDPSPKDKKKLKKLIEELEDIQREARKLTRSGHPGVRAEALRHLENARQDLVWLKRQLHGSK